MNIIRGKAYPAARRVIYGPPGVGKSTFACSEPGAIALDYEDGLDAIGADRVKGASSWSDSLSLVREACSGAGEHLAVVIDTVDKLAEQASAEVCREGKKKSLSDFKYGDGYEALSTKWRELLFVLEGARVKGRSVTLVAHVQNKPVDDPTLGTYGKYVAVLEKRCWTATHRWADAVLFANYESGMLEGRAIMTGARVLYTQAATGFDAKHRPNVMSPLPLDWQAYAEAVRAGSRSLEELTASIRSLSKGEDVARAEDYIAKANGDPLRLASIETALRKKNG